MSTLYRGETIRNKGFDRSRGRYLARVVSFQPAILGRDAEAVCVALPLGCVLALPADTPDDEAIASAVRTLFAQGWRETYAEAAADAEAERAGRESGAIKLG